MPVPVASNGARALPSDNLLNRETPDSASGSKVIFGAFQSKADTLALVAEGAAKVRCDTMTIYTHSIGVICSVTGAGCCHDGQEG